MVGRGLVVGAGLVEVGSGSDGSGATTVSCCELLTITSAMTSPITVRMATAATIHNQRGDFGSSGSGGCGGAPPTPASVDAVGGEPAGENAGARAGGGGAGGVDE